MAARSSSKSKPKSPSLTALARSLDTQKRALPTNAKAAPVATRERASNAKTPSAPAMSLRDVVRARVEPKAPSRPVVTAAPARTASASDDIRARLQQLAGTSSRPATQPPVRTQPAAPARPLPAATNKASAPAKAPAPSVAPRTGVPRTQAPVAPRVLSATQKAVKASEASTRRRYPRAALTVQARLALTDDPRKVFEAALPTANISVGGMFLKSTFFLKVGTRLSVELTLPERERPVKVKGEVVRVETSGDAESGFALRFTEYFESSEVALATHFLSPVLRDFIAEYARAHRFEADPEYLAHTADVLAAWELKKAELGGDVWALTQGTPPKQR